MNHFFFEARLEARLEDINILEYTRIYHFFFFKHVWKNIEDINILEYTRI